MERQTVIDEDGEWITNTALFPFTDPTTGVRFEPGTRTKAKVTLWVTTQSVLDYRNKDDDVADYEAKLAQVEAERQLALAEARAKAAEADAEAVAKSKAAKPASKPESEEKK